MSLGATKNSETGATPLLELYRTEVETHAAMLTTGLLAISSGNSTEATLNEIMRAAHSIKGAARIVDLPDPEKIAHALEDCFVAAQQKQIALQGDDIEAMLQAVDLIARLGNDRNSSGPNEVDIQRTVLALTAIKHGTKPQKTGLTKVMTSAAEPVAAPPIDAPEQPEASAKTPNRPTTQSIRRPAEAKKESGDRAVRVTAQSLNRLMALAGELRIQSRRLEPFADSLKILKNTQIEVGGLIDRMQLELERDTGRINTQTLNEAQQHMNRCQQLLGERMAKFEKLLHRSENLSHRLYREVIASRLRPFSDGMSGFPRMVHDLSRKLGKKVRFDIHGKQTEVDRDILEKLEAPLNHLIRNSIDHGIEAPEERRAAGKDETGVLSIDASHKKGMLSIAVKDDGRGIDRAAVKAKLLERNLASQSMIDNMDDAELLEFLFVPGFTTARKITEISGRGVGLDVVLSMVQDVGGHIRVESEFGKFTAFHLDLPVTRSVLRVLIVEIGGEAYACPLTRINRILKVVPENLKVLENRQYLTFDDKHVGLVPAHQILELQAGPADSECSVVVVEGWTDMFALSVDRILGEHDIVVRPLDTRLGKVPNISSAAIMEDGSPLLVLDVDDIVRSINNLLSGGRLRKVAGGQARTDSHRRKRVLVVDDSLTVREVERQLLEARGYFVETAADGMEGWNAVRSGSYDLVISDVSMPRMSGIEFVTNIKQDPRLKHIPVMMVSYKNREEDRMRGMEAGANYYMAKSSFTDESLIDAVRDLIGEALT